MKGRALDTAVSFPLGVGIALEPWCAFCARAVAGTLCWVDSVKGLRDTLAAVYGLVR